MASAKFLEEALSTDVDESAVNAIVGSLENQLVTSAPNISNNQTISTEALNQNLSVSNGGGNVQSTQKQHGIPNGETLGPGVLNDTSKVNATSSAIVSNAGNIVVSSISSSSSSDAINVSNAFTTVPTSHANLTVNMSKANDALKLVYPQTASVNSRVTFPSQTLPNGGTVSLGQTVLQTSPSVGNLQNKQQQQTIVIKTSGGSQAGAPGLVTVPMSVVSTALVNSVGTPVSSMAGVMTIAKSINSNTNNAMVTSVVTTGSQQQQTIVAATSVNVPTGTTQPPSAALLPGVQIVNVRAGTPSQGQKAIPPRVVIGNPHMIGARPGHPLTLQTLQQLQPGQQGHLLLKTENGQYQLLRVGPAPPTASATAVATNAPQLAVSASQQTATYRLHTVPAAVSRLNTQFSGPPLTLRKTIQVQQQPTTVTTTPINTTLKMEPTSGTNASATPVTTVQQMTTSGTPVVTQTTPKQSSDNTKEKCRKFLANLLELSSREPKNVEKNVRTLIQELIDMKVEPEEFCDRLERLLNASPQPCLIGFLKKSLPLLRQSLVLKEMVIDGIKPPPTHVVFSLANSTMTSQVGTVQTAGMRPTLPTQVRVMTSTGATTTTVVRPGMQPRLLTPASTVVRSGTIPQTRMLSTTTIRQQTPYNTTNNVIVPTSQPPALHPVSGAPPLFPTSGTQIRVANVRPPMQQIRTSTINSVRTPTPVRTTTPKVTPAKPAVPSSSIKAAAKDKEKKSFASSINYAPDDDINDVAAMGGVNLAEETQRILGSTEFVGTQIRSCKDELFLHTNTLQQRLRQITQQHGLDDASGDVTALVSHATQELLKNLVEKLALTAEHRIEIIKSDSRYEVSHDVRGQLKFLEELDRAERKRHDEIERELLLRAAKSRSKTEDPEQAKLKAKAKEMQRAEMEELRQREANLTALQAIGPRKKPRLENENGNSSNSISASGSGSSSGGPSGRNQMPLRPRLKRANLRDLLFILEQEKDKCKSLLLYKSYLK